MERKTGQKKRVKSDERTHVTNVPAGDIPQQEEGGFSIADRAGESLETLKKAREDAEFHIPDMEDIKKKAEDLEEKKRLAAAERLHQEEREAGLKDFEAKIFPAMADRLCAREEARGVSEKNFGLFDSAINTLLFGGKEDKVALAKAAFIVEAAKAVKSSRAFFDELEKRWLIKRDIGENVVEELPAGRMAVRLIAPSKTGTVKVAGKLYGLAFRPPLQYSGAIRDALTQRAGHLEVAERKATKELEVFLRGASDVPLWQIFAGTPGKSSVFIPFHEFQVRGEAKRVLPGLLLVESDGKRVVCQGGSRYQEQFSVALMAKGISLYLNDLRDPEFRGGKKDDPANSIRIAFHRRIWAARRYAEQHEGGADVVLLKKELSANATLLPDDFFSKAKLVGTALVVYVGGEKSAGLWRVKGKDEGRDEIYKNVFALIERTKDGGVFFRQWPSHMDFMFTLYKEVDLESDKVEPGLGLSFFKWAKGNHSPKPVPENLQEPEDKKRLRLQTKSEAADSVVA